MHRSSGDAVFGDIDLLTKILLRLPVKDVLRSKCVCKTWRFLICEPQFCHWHTLKLCRKHKHNPNPYPSGILYQTYDCLFFKKAKIIPFNTNSNTRFIHLDVHKKGYGLVRYEIQQSSNGLLLWDSTPERVSSQTYDAETKELYQGCNYFYVTNLSTGHCVRINHFGYQFHSDFSKPYLVFEPWKSPHYKIIFFAKVVGDRNNDLTTKMKMSVYSSETGSWSKVDVVPSFPNTFSYLDRGIYCNGAIHWYPLGNLVYFDIDQFCLKNLATLQFPPSLDLKLVYFGECGGKLQLITKKDNERLRYDIWELKEDYSGLIVRYYIDLTTLQANSFDVRVLCIVCQPPNEDEEEESMLAILVVNIISLVSYNLKDHSSRILYQDSDGFYRAYFQSQYFETLASILPSYNNI